MSTLRSFTLITLHTNNVFCLLLRRITAYSQDYGTSYSEYLTPSSLLGCKKPQTQYFPINGSYTPPSFARSIIETRKEMFAVHNNPALVIRTTCTMHMFMVASIPRFHVLYWSTDAHLHWVYIRCKIQDTPDILYPVCIRLYANLAFRELNIYISYKPYITLQMYLSISAHVPT